MKKRYKLAILGAGWVVREVWMPILIKNDSFHIVGIYDTQYSALHLISSKYPSLKFFQTIKELYESKPNVALIATPNRYHVDYAEEFLINNISVVVEKPICLCIEEYRRLERAASQSKAVFIPISVSKFRSDVQYLANLLISKTHGKIQNMSLRWIRASGIPKLGGWFTNKALAGGGVGYDLGWHVLDVGLSFIGYPSIFQAIGKSFSSFLISNSSNKADWRHETQQNECFPIDVEDQFIGFIKTSNNVVINFHVAWASHVKTDYTEIMINTENSFMHLLTTFGFTSNRLEAPSLIITQKGYTKQIDLPESVIGEEYKQQIHHIANILHKRRNNKTELLNVRSVIEALELMYRSDVS